jgi:predicted GNAT family N-acyltransferase
LQAGSGSTLRIEEIAFASRQYGATLAFRDAHLRRPLGLAQDEADLKGEEGQIHIAALAGDAVVGTVVLKPIDAHLMKLRQMAVSPDLRGTGLGRRIVLFAEDCARARGFTRIEMSARESARGFYEALGYQVVGPSFLEVTIPHLKMVKDLG